MVLAAGDRVKFYTSSNLIDWAHTSDFGQLEGAHGGVWECPDLFELPDDGSYDSKKWVLVVSVGNGVFVKRKGARMLNEKGRDLMVG